MKRFVSIVAALLLLLGLIIVFPQTPSVHGLLLGTEVQITSDPNRQFDPRIDGDYIVYTDDRAGNADVYLYNITTGEEIPIADSLEDEYFNDISGNLVVYEQSRWDDDDIFVYNITSGETRQITDPENREFARRRNPAIHGTKVVWQDNRSGNYDIYCYDLETDTEFIVSLGSTGFPAPGDQINPNIHGNLVVWEDHRDPSNQDIYYTNIADLDAGSVLIPIDVPGDPKIQSFPDVYGRYVVFNEAHPSDINNNDIVLWDLDTDQAIWTTVDPTSQERPRIDGTRVVWEDCRNGNIDIYTYEVSTGDMDSVVTDPSMQFLNDVSGDRIVWTDMRHITQENPINFDIYMFEIFGPPDIDVSPTSLSFGDVEVGQSSLLIATISNLGESPLELTVTQTGSIDFTHNPTTATVAPDESVDLTVTYAPSDLGPDEAVLTINCNDPDEPTIDVTLTGNGVEAVVPPEQMFQELLDFYDENIENEDLQGIGPGNSPENREHAIRNMIVAANNLYADGLIEEACEQLHDIYKKIDGEPNPPDFIVGDPTVLEEFRQMVLELLEAFSCECCT